MKVEETDARLSLRFPSDGTCAQQALRLCDEFVGRHGFPKAYKLIIVLRELINNAIEHGNGGIPERSVECVLEQTGRSEFTLTVEDEGAGFSYVGLKVRPPEAPGHIRNRGYVLVNAFSNRLEFNESGNRVKACIDLADDTRNYSGQPPEVCYSWSGGASEAVLSCAVGLRQALTFLLGDGLYGLDVRKVREVLRVLPVMTVPDAPSYVRGLLNLHGQVFPVVELRRRVRLEPQPDTSRTCMIVIQAMHQSHVCLTGLIVDHVVDVVYLDPSQVEPADDGGEGCIYGCCRTDDRRLLLVDADAMIHEIELRTVSLAAGGPLRETRNSGV